VVIAVGGDGTILNAARLALPFAVPVLGINAGRLGFLAGLERHELALLPRLATGDYTLERRMLLEAQVWQGERVMLGGHCLNDAVISRQGVSHAVEVPVSCGGNMITCLGDGVIFATPTGSTAYNYSAGGPVAEPGVETILLTPICSHRRMARTIVFSPEARFSVDIAGEGLALALDAAPPAPLLPGQRVSIRRADVYAQFINLKTEHFLSILNAKMG